MNTKNFVAAGLIIALLISILAPFIASSSPDGLESTAEKFEGLKGKDYHAFRSPLPGYVMPSTGETEKSGAFAMVIGTLVIFGTGYGFARVIKNRV